MKASRVVAIGLVAAAGLWVASGYLFPHHPNESQAAVRPGEAAKEKLFRVGVMDAKREPHGRTITLSGRTEAFQKVMATARSNGILTDLKVRRGDEVKAGDILAVLSDEAREAQVMQAEAILTQRMAELDAKRRLIEVSALPRLEMVNLESQAKAAQAGLAAAQAERDRGMVRAPWSGIVTDVPAEIGQTLSSGKEIAQIVSLDPMLAVVEVAERKLAGIKVGDPAKVRLVTGDVAKGKIRFVSKSASPTTRTYRVEVELANPDHTIPDGITAEVGIKLSPTPSTRVPRSALTFSSAGDLGVRVVNAGGVVAFVPVTIAEDDQAFMWVAGLPDTAQVIVQGQDFVREGQKVDAVNTAEGALAAAN